MLTTSRKRPLERLPFLSPAFPVQAAPLLVTPPAGAADKAAADKAAAGGDKTLATQPICSDVRTAAIKACRIARGVWAWTCDDKRMRTICEACEEFLRKNTVRVLIFWTLTAVDNSCQ